MSESTSSLEQHVDAALQGNREALEHIVAGLQDPIFGLCLRMLGSVEHARDATQEVLVRVITRLSSFRAESRLTTWAYRIAANYLIDSKRQAAESLTFEHLDTVVGQPPNDIAAQTLAHAPAELLAEEAFLGCTLGMLRCLDREQRLAFILGGILELAGNDAAAILGVEPATYRKRLSRARARLEAFMRPRCGVVDAQAACRCEHQVNLNVEQGLLDPQRLRLVGPQPRAELQEHIRQVRTVIDSLELYRRLPAPEAPVDVVQGLRELLHSGRLPYFH